MTSPFSDSLAAAKRRHRILLLAGALAIVVTMLGVGGFIAQSRGVAVKVLPEEIADVARIEVASGLAMSLAASVYVLGGKVVIGVDAPGFRPATRRLSAEVLGKTVVVELLPLPGELIAETSPAGDETRWSVGNAVTHVGATFETELEAGAYTIGADHPFFVPESRDVSLERGRITKLTIPLSKIEGRLRIDSVPQGARVFVDDAETGVTPLDIARPGGAYDLRIVDEGFNPSADTVRVVNSAPVVERTYRLQPLSGGLTVAVDPPGGILLVDGRKVAPSERLELSVGRSHAVSYDRSGYFPANESVTVAAGEDKTLRITLEPSFGEVAVASEPTATIVVDGVAKGETPAILNLPTRKTKIVLRRDGFRTVEQTVTPKNGERISVRHRLLSEREARIAEAAQVYENSLGMTLRLFAPARFTMGAPRHERGQRANEFLRDVRLTRHFYAGLHEVTNEQFKAFAPDHPSGGGPRHPVVGVRWTEAARFSNWLSEREGLAPFYVFSGGRYSGIDRDADGYRLLSEAEWEWLARRAGRRETVVFPWGDTTTIPKNAGNIADESAKGSVSSYVPNYNDGHAGTAPVGSFPAEASGLHDLTGNVSEWVHDRYSLEPPPPGQVFDDPLGGAYGEIHVFKGSSFRSADRTTLRPAYREGFVGGRDDIGFRIGRYLYGEDDAAN